MVESAQDRIAAYKNKKGGKRTTSATERIAAYKGGGAPAAEPSGDGGGKGLFDIGPLKAVRDAMSSAGNVTLEALDILDMPRAGIVAGLTEIGDGLQALAGREAHNSAGRLQDTGFNWDDFRTNFNNRVGVGDVIEANTDIDNQWVKRGLGFTGDILTDPLTYITFGAAGAVKGAGGAAAKGGRRLLFKDEVVREIGKLGADDVARLGGQDAVNKVADSVLRDGTGRLAAHPQTAEAIGATAGIQFAGRTIPRTARIADANAKLWGGTKRAITSRTWDKLSPAVKAQWERVPGRSRIVALTGSEKSGFDYMNSSREATNKARTWGTDKAAEFNVLFDRHADADWVEVRRVIEDPSVDINKLQSTEGAAAREVSDWLESLRKEYSELAGEELPKLTDYFPRWLTSEAMEKVKPSKGGRARRGSKVGVTDPTASRGLRRGQMFLGERLNTGSIEEVREISQRVLGDERIELFLDDPKAIFDGYIKALSRKMRRERFVSNLEKHGLAEYVDEIALSVQQTEAVKAERAMSRASRAAQRADRQRQGAKARAEKLEEDLADVSADVEMAREEALDNLLDEKDQLIRQLNAEMADIEDPVLGEVDEAAARAASAAVGDAELQRATALDELSAAQDMRFARTDSARAAQGEIEKELRETRKKIAELEKAADDMPPGASLEELRQELMRAEFQAEDLQAQVAKAANNINNMQKTQRGDLASGSVYGTAEQAARAATQADDFAATTAGLSKEQWDALTPDQRLAEVEQLIKDNPKFAGRADLQKQLEDVKAAKPEAGTAKAAKSYEEQMLEDLRAELAEETDRVLKRELQREIKELEEVLASGVQKFSKSTKGLNVGKEIDNNAAAKFDQMLDELHEAYFAAAADAYRNSGYSDPLAKAVAKAKEDGKPLSKANLDKLAKRIEAEKKVKQDRTDKLKGVTKKKDALEARIKKLSADGPATESVVRSSMTPGDDLYDRVAELERKLEAAKKSRRNVKEATKELNAAKRGYAETAKLVADARKVEADEWAGLNSMMTVERVNAQQLVEANDELADRLSREIEQARGDKRAILEGRYDMSQEAGDLFRAALQHEQRGERILAQIAQLEGLQKRRLADQHSAYMDFVKAHNEAPPRLTLNEERQLSEIALGTLSKVSHRQGLWADPEVINAIDDFMSLSMTRSKRGPFIKVFDLAQSRWKAQALLSTGYHGRNFMTAVYMNHLAGMSPTRWHEWRHFRRLMRAEGDPKKVEAALGKISDPQLREAMRTTYEWRGAIFGERGVEGIEEVYRNTASEAGIFSIGAKDEGLRRRLDPTSTQFGLYHLNFKAAARVERMARGPLFIDGLMKGMDPEAALERVVKHHFDYSDLSQMEERWLKRLLPFYTWTRNNVPVMLEYIARKPGGVMWYLHAQRNIEAASTPEDMVPRYFGEAGAIRTPWKQNDIPILGGLLGHPDSDGQLYAAPDLPFLNINDTLNTSQLLGSVTPILKTPIEVSMGKKVFNDAPIRDDVIEAPTAWKWVMPALMVTSGFAGMPKVERHGTRFFMSEKDAYKLESAMPALGRLRRWFPEEELYKERKFTSVLSTVFGFGSFTNGERQQGLELYLRNMETQKRGRKASQMAAHLAD